MISKIREFTAIFMMWLAFKFAPKEMADVMQEAFELGLQVQKAAYDQLSGTVAIKNDTPKH